MLDLNYPLLKSIEIDSSIISFLNKKLDYYIENVKDQQDDLNGFHKGFQTKNLLFWEDEEFKNFLNSEILNLLSEKLMFKKEKIKYKWTHMLEYAKGGKMDAHRHMHNEDFVFFIYLNSCESSGETIFYLNDYDEDSKQRTKVPVLPQKNLGVCFSALVLHEGLATYDDKRIFVLGFRLS